MLDGRNGRVALITGGAGGIGSAIAHGLARDGLTVVIAGRNRERAFEDAERINRDGGSAFGVDMDVGDPASVAAGVRVTHDQVGAVSVIERRWGRIVNISSDAGRVGSSLESIYAASKGAIISFTKTIARETARYGVTANIVSPGPIETRMLQDVVRAHKDAEKVLASLSGRIPMKRLGRPEDVAGAVRFFASEQAGYITGQTLSVSGGLTMA